MSIVEGHSLIMSKELRSCVFIGSVNAIYYSNFNMCSKSERFLGQSVGDNAVQCKPGIDQHIKKLSNRIRKSWEFSKMSVSVVSKRNFLIKYFLKLKLKFRKWKCRFFQPKKIGYIFMILNKVTKISFKTLNNSYVIRQT